MAGQTNGYQLPYQDLSDAPNGPAGQQALAEAVDGQLERVDGDIGQLGLDLADVQSTLAVETPWQDITAFENGWGTTSFLRCRIDAANNLHVQGKLDVIGTHGTNAFTLPVGFRPNLPEFLKLDAAAPQSTAENSRINIGSDGNVTIYYSNPGSYISINIVVNMA